MTHLHAYQYSPGSQTARVRSANSDEIPTTPLLFLQSYLSLARFILTCTHSDGRHAYNTSTSLGKRRTSWVSVLNKVGLAHLVIKGMRLALPLHALLLYKFTCGWHRSPYHGPMRAAAVRPRSAAEYLIRSAVVILHPRQKETTRADMCRMNCP